MQKRIHAALRLFETADAQQGFFTAKQAKQLGYSESSMVYHARVGNWIREHRGIYRLARYPLGERPDIMLWYLWSCNRREEPQGVYSHETALALYDLSDINPARLHMSVPRGFRRNSPIPDILDLHIADVPPSDIRQMYGVAVTHPLRTILDVVQEGALPEDMLRQAVSEALARGLVTRRESRRLPGNLVVESAMEKGVRT